MVTKEQLQQAEEKFNAAEKAFNNNPCSKAATTVSNLRQELKALKAQYYKENERQFARQLANDIRQIVDYASGNAATLPTVF